jgi:hypothetical protein
VTTFAGIAEVSVAGAAPILAVAIRARIAYERKADIFGHRPRSDRHDRICSHAVVVFVATDRKGEKHERIHRGLVSTPDARRLHSGRSPRGGPQCFHAAWVMQVSYDPASLGDTLFLTRSVDGLFPMSNVSYWYRAHVAVSQSMSDIGVRTDIA